MEAVLLFAGMVVGGVILLFLLLTPFVIFVEFMFGSRFIIEKQIKKVSGKDITFSRYEYMAFWLPVYGLCFCLAIYYDYDNLMQLEMVMAGLALIVAVAAIKLAGRIGNVMGSIKVLSLIAVLSLPMVIAQVCAIILNIIGSMGHSPRYMGDTRIVGSLPK